MFLFDFMNSINNLNLANNNIVTTTISHELKTPLNAIIGFTDLILEEESINKIKDYADIIKNNSSLLLDKIHRVIDFNSLDNDNAVFIEEVNISELLEQAISLLSDEFRRNNRTFSITCDPLKAESPSVLFTDKDKLEKCFYHLLLSTVYLNKKGQIFINFGIHPNNESVQVLFSEKPNTDSILFIPHSYTESSNPIYTKGLEDGIGINLAICDKLSRIMGGRMRLQLDKDNKKIAFELPVKNLFKSNSSSTYDMTLLVVDDDQESYKQIQKLIGGHSLQIIRTSSFGFSANILEHIAEVGIIIINCIHPYSEVKEIIKKYLNKSNGTSFLINMANYESLNELSSNSDNVFWFRQPTIKVQLEEIIDNHFKNKNKANPFINTNYERTKV